MKYIDLMQNSEKALTAGLSYILENPLPSCWSKEGLGWHERWANSRYGGVYTGCEGIILLSQAKQYINKTEYDSIVNAVYKHNLCIIFDDSIEISGNDENATHKQHEQRTKALNVTYKLARFLWASSYVDDGRDSELEGKIVRRLCSLFDREQKMFKEIGPAKNGDMLATAFAYIALNRAGYIQPELKCVEEYFTEYLDNVDVVTKSNIDEIIFIVWAVSQNAAACDHKLVEKCVDFLNVLISSPYLKHDVIVDKPYTIRDCKRNYNETFKINKFFVFIQALELLIQSKYANIECIKNVLDEIEKISSLVAKNQVYSRNGKCERLLFWENFYALQILNDFITIIRNSECKEDWFMVISPKLFKGSDFAVDEKLCVLIMPFSTDWAKTMHRTFKHAAKGFNVWRSDDEIYDDSIIQTVWEKINRARFVIADCTGKNPNVFYELGIAHTLGKPVFMCAQSKEDIPFDISSFPHHIYGMKLDEAIELEEAIHEFIEKRVLPERR